jgi:hypothetical protein
MTRTVAVFAATLATTVAVALAPAPIAQQPSSAAMRAFDGSWSATGQRQTLPTEGGRVAAVVQLSGAVVLSRDTGLGSGFTGEAIGFDDGRSTVAGRAVWTNARGDRIFSVVNGEPIGTGRRIAGTFTGGTGRYAGITGEYTLTWQYVVDNDGTVNGRAVDLKGRFGFGTSGR